MAKKQQQKPSTKPAHHKGSGTSFPEFLQNVKLQSWLIFGLAFLLYANTLKHGFVYDDGIVITDNMYTTQGVKGIGGILSHDTFFGFFKSEGNEMLVTGGRYRPMSLVLFAVLYQIGGASPFLFHLATVLLFAFGCLLLYRTLLLLLKPAEQSGGYLVAWLATLLFAVHPIHTEVVANIKSCDEILTLIGCLAALYYALKAWDTGNRKWAIAAGVVFFLACLSKENAVAFAVLIPLALWFFRSPGTGNTSIWKTSIPIFTAFVAFIIIRGAILPWSSVLGGSEPMELMNNPFLKFEGGQWVKFAPAERLATIFYTLWKYLQLLVVPHPLTHDYYPRHIGIMTFGNPLVLLSLVAYSFMGYWAIRGFKRRDAVAFGLLLFLLPLGIVSNLLLPVGTNMSERFLFLPSVGFCLVAALFLSRLMENNRSLAMGLFGISVLLFSIKTILRNPVWESNDRLFMTDVAVSENSAKLQNACGQLLLKQLKTEKNAEKKRAMGQDAIARINKALTFYPDFKAAIINRAGTYFELGQFPESIADYRKALELAPTDPQRKTMLALSLREGGKFYGQQKNDLVNAFKCLNESWQINPKDPETARLLGVGNFVQGKIPEATEWFVKAEEVAPKDAVSLWELGLAYSNMGNQAKAVELHERATAIDPNIAQKAASGGMQ